MDGSLRHSGALNVIKKAYSEAGKTSYLTLQFPPQFINVGLEQLLFNAISLAFETIRTNLLGSQFGTLKGIVVSVLRPRARLDPVEIYKPPIDNGMPSLDAEVVTDGRRNINSRPEIGLVLRRRISEYILPVFRGKRAAILPLGKTIFTIVPDLNPLALANALARSFEIPVEPRDHARRLRLVTPLGNIIVR